MPEKEQWICLSINQNAIKEGDLVKIIREDIENVFGDDLLDTVILCDRLSKEIFEMNVENYVFVKVKNYFPHVKKMKDSNIIFGVLDSYDNPTPIDESEVFKFKDSLKSKSNEEELKVFDAVQVKEGYLKGLTGIVTEKPSVATGKYKVVFKFHTNLRTEGMYRKNLVYLFNILDFEFIKSRYSTYMRTEKNNEDKLCRGKPNKHQ